MIYVRIYLITLLMAIMYAFFVSEFQLLDGGLIGLALIINYLSKIETGIIYFLLNIPVLLWVFKVDKVLFRRSVFGMGFFSGNMLILSYIPNPFDLGLYASMIISAIVLGICFYMMSTIKASFGGVSPIGIKLNEWNIMKLSYFYWITDMTILVLGLFFFGWDNFSYSCIFVTIQSFAVEACSKVVPKLKTAPKFGTVLVNKAN